MLSRVIAWIFSITVILSGPWAHAKSHAECVSITALLDLMPAAEACRGINEGWGACFKSKVDAIRAAARQQRIACEAREDTATGQSADSLALAQEQSSTRARGSLEKDLETYAKGNNPASAQMAYERVREVSRTLEAIHRAAFGEIDAQIRAITQDISAINPASDKTSFGMIRTDGVWASIGNPPSSTFLDSENERITELEEKSRLEAAEDAAREERREAIRERVRRAQIYRMMRMMGAGGGMGASGSTSSSSSYHPHDRGGYRETVPANRD